MRPQRVHVPLHSDIQRVRKRDAGRRTEDGFGIDKYIVYPRTTTPLQLRLPLSSSNHDGLGLEHSGGCHGGHARDCVRAPGIVCIIMDHSRPMFNDTTDMIGTALPSTGDVRGVRRQMQNAALKGRT